MPRASRGVRYGDRVSHPHGERVWKGGHAPSPENIFAFKMIDFDEI